MTVESTERLRAIQGRRDSEAERVAYMIARMPDNKAYVYAADRAGGDPTGALLEEYRERFRWYRTSWRGQPRKAIDQKLYGEPLRQANLPPLSVDIETAAVCDLACAFCYRQWIATPDQIMREDVYRRIIDQCAELGVPSVKLNWRGEPLLHPQLAEFIGYAKRAGVIETIINTDAVTLTDEKSRALVDSGLDLVIYSFDGGTKTTYESMRVGRFRPNSFEKVYENIRRFQRIRDEMGSPFPRTKIQMILTKDTFHEQEQFFALFAECVDDVSVKAYSERGGELSDLDENLAVRYAEFLRIKGLAVTTPYWRNMQGKMFISTGRLPCEQPYQRLMVSYDGTVSMCCYDWGTEYPVGYVDAQAFEEGHKHYKHVMEKAQGRAKGFELLANVQMPKRYIDPPEQVQTLREIWNGEIINDVRRAHVEGRLEEIPICKACPFKETHRWESLDDGPGEPGGETP